MVTPSAETMAGFSRCMQNEQAAWHKVSGRLPGTPAHNRSAWSRWVECVRQSDVARKMIHKEILADEILVSGELTAPALGRFHLKRNQTRDHIAPSRAPGSPAPIPVLQAGLDANDRLTSVLQQADFEPSQFQAVLLRLRLGPLSESSFMVTVTNARLGLSRTYEAFDQSGWLVDFQQDLKEGVFSQ